jgi:hypothetical protein
MKTKSVFGIYGCRIMPYLAGFVLFSDLMGAPPLWAATIYWNMGTTSSDPSPTAINVSELSGGVLSGFGAINETSPSSGYTGASGQMNTAFNVPASGTSNLTWTLTAVGGGLLQFTDFTFGSRSTPSGPTSWTLFVTVGAGAETAVASGTMLANNAWTLQDSANFSTTPGSMVSFRLSVPSNGSTGTGNWRLDDFTLTYTYHAVPEPARVMLMGLGMTSLLWRRRRGWNAQASL